jgi:hypothetical protein
MLIRRFCGVGKERALTTRRAEIKPYPIGGVLLSPIDRFSQVKSSLLANRYRQRRFHSSLLCADDIKFHRQSGVSMNPSSAMRVAEYLARSIHTYWRAGETEGSPPVDPLVLPRTQPGTRFQPVSQFLVPRVVTNVRKPKGVLPFWLCWRSLASRQCQPTKTTVDGRSR